MKASSITKRISKRLFTSKNKGKWFFLAIGYFLSTISVHAQDHSNAFISLWNTDKMAADTHVQIPSIGNNYGYYWEKVDDVTVNSGSYKPKSGSLELPELLSKSGTYRIYIKGDYTAIEMWADANAATALMAIESWGNIIWSTMFSAFRGCNNLVSLPVAAPNLTQVTNMAFMFYGASAFNSPINSWNITNVTNMGFMFFGATAFNSVLNSWNTKNVTNMEFMFYDAAAFNSPINNWNTQIVTDMSYMFFRAKSFNQPIQSWNTGYVTNMISMFNAASAFNQPINNWNTENVTNLAYMFQHATAFNQPVFKWNTQKVINMRSIFESASSFNQHIGTWQLNQNVSLPNAFNNSGIDCENYGLTLKGWALNPSTPNNITLGAQTHRYASDAVPHRNSLLTKGWIINDAGVSSECFLPLPVTLIKYAVKPQKEAVLISWQTVTERNNSHFVLEKSRDGIQYRVLAKIAPGIDGNTPTNYQYTDENPESGISYYRLSQVDFDGTQQYHGIRSVNMLSNIPSVTVYPNPVSNMPVTIKFQPHLYNKASLYNINGLLMDMKSNLKNDQPVVFETQQLIPGTYLIQLSGKETATHQFIKQ